MQKHLSRRINSPWLYGLILCFASGCTDEAATSQDLNVQDATPFEDVSNPTTEPQEDAVDWSDGDAGNQEPPQDSSPAEDGETLPDAPQPTDTIETEDTSTEQQPDGTEPVEDTGASEEDAGATELQVDSLWPTNMSRGATELLVLRGVHLDQLSEVSCSLLEDDGCQVLWEKRELLIEDSILRIPVEISASHPLGTRSFTLEGPDFTSAFQVEVHLAPGEQETMIGTLDLGEVMAPTPWADCEFFQAVGVEVGEDFIFFTDAGWNRIYVSVLGIENKVLWGEELSPGIAYPLAGSGETGPSTDGPALDIPLSEPKGLCYTVENEKPRLFIADTTHHQIRVLNLSDSPIEEMGITIEPGHIATVVGTGEFGYGGDEGPALEARLFRPWRVRGCQGPLLHIGDVENYRLRVVNRQESPHLIAGTPLPPGFIRTVAGDGTLGFSGDGGLAQDAQVSIPKGMVSMGDGLMIFSDPENNRLRMVNLGAEAASYGGKTVSPGHISSLGTPGDFDGFISTPGLNHPTGLKKDPLHGIWIADTYSHTIKLMNGTPHPLYRGGKVTVPGDQSDIYAGIEHYHAGYPGIDWAENTYLSSPFDLALHERRGELYIADEENRVIRRLKLWTPMPPLQGGVGPFPNLAELPGNQATLNTNTGILAGVDEEWEVPLGPRNGVFDLESFHLPEGEKLSVVGSLPGCIVTTGDLIIDGQLLVEAGHLPPKAGGSANTGGSHGSAGAGQTEGDLIGNESLFPLSGGQSGGSGASGGGALALSAGGTLTISGLVYAQGITSPANKGSGSGGGLRLQSKEAIECTGVISAEGGKGPYPGGDGRISLQAPVINCNASPHPFVILSSPDFDALPGY